MTILGPGSNLAKIILIFFLLITQNYVILYINLKQKKPYSLHFTLVASLSFFYFLFSEFHLPCLSSLFYTWPSSSLASFLATLTHSLSFKCCNCANALTLSFRCCYCIDAFTLFFRCCCYGLSSCYEFVFYFYPKPPIFFFFFFSCFCFSHPKH